MTKKLQFKFILLLVLLSLNYQINAQTCTLPWQDPVSLHNIQNVNLNPGFSYSTGVIDISCATPGVDISADIEGLGGLDAGQDFLNIYYKLDGGAQQLLVNRVTQFALETITSSSLSGNTLEVIIEAGNTAPDEIYRVSNLKITESSSLSVADIKNEKILLYPNPVKDILHVNINDTKPYSVSLINILGKEVLNKTNLKGESSLSIEDFESGIYFARITTETSQTVKKLIIK